MKPRSIGTIVLAFVCGCVPSAQAGTPPLSVKRVAFDLQLPLLVTYAPGDFDRVFIVQKRGLIKILNLNSEVVNPIPFLDLSAQVSIIGEQGLLGLAFHPNYEANGRFFVNYTNVAGDTVIAEFAVSPNADLADAASERIVLTFSQPESNHNGGWIAFGPKDGYLYIATGDGGGAGDPNNFGQDKLQLLGKMLRIGVDGALPYAIPADNPFVGDPQGLDEIWAYGLRNPWRCSFDSQTGDLYIGDVGQSLIEEIDFQPASSLGGENYGWRCKEGDSCFSAGCCNNTGFTAPIHTYEHSKLDLSCSVTGGYVYRGCTMPELQGTYFFADFCSRQIWSFHFDGSVSNFQDRTAELAAPEGLNIRSISSFGRDAFGEIYICDLADGEVFKIIPDSTVQLQDCNRNGRQDACDILSGVSLDENTNAIPDECEIPVPALSVWGLIVSALLLLCAGSVVAMRRSSPSPA